MRKMKQEHWIIGLMRENYEAVGFIPATTVEQRYIAQGRAIIQTDARGRNVGYLLHGALRYAAPISVAQHCIDIDNRLRGYGEAAVQTLIARAARIGASAITVRCADTLPSVDFWRAQGFQVRRIIPGGAARNRSIVCMALPLAVPLFEAQL